MLIKVSAYLMENKNYRLKAKEEQDSYFANFAIPLYKD
jgi:hypothetical protein